MAEYIERGAALKEIDQSYGLYEASLRVSGIPTADVAPVRHGRWERVCTLRDETVFRCSNCNREVKVPYGLSKERWAPYCHCGAKMDLEG